MKITTVVGLISFLILTGISVYGQSSNRHDPDDYAFDGRIVRIKGKATIINHPELGVTPATFTGIVFRREGCKDCLIVVNTDADGNYDVSLGKGRYRIIKRGGSGGLNPTYDMLAPDQPRIIEAKPGPYPTEFNIKIVVPKD